MYDSHHCTLLHNLILLPSHSLTTEITHDLHNHFTGVQTIGTSDSVVGIVVGFVVVIIILVVIMGAVIGVLIARNRRYQLSIQEHAG